MTSMYYDTSGQTLYPRGAMPMEVLVGSEFHNKINYHRAMMHKRPLSHEEINAHLAGNGIGSVLSSALSFLPALAPLLAAI